MKHPLVIIPARGGSKGIPHKNIKSLGGKPLICRAIDNARAIAPDEDICVTTDDAEIIRVVEDYGLHVPFVRPAHLASDTCGTYDVLLHAWKHYVDSPGHANYDCIVLLQTTSPFTRPDDVREALGMYTGAEDMVVSVKETDANPYYNCFEENAEGFLGLSKGNGGYARRQDCPKAYQYNGAVYVINPESLLRSPLSKFKRVKKYVMDAEHSLDLDTMIDWELAELMLAKGLVK